MIPRKLNLRNPFYIKLIFLLFLSADGKCAAAYDPSGEKLAEAWSTNWRVVEFRARLSELQKRDLDEGAALTKDGKKVQVIIHIGLSHIVKGFWASFKRDIIPRLVSREGRDRTYPLFKIFNDFKSKDIARRTEADDMVSFFIPIDPDELHSLTYWLKNHTKIKGLSRLRCQVEHNFRPSDDLIKNALNEHFLSLFRGIGSKFIEEGSWDGAY
tara:strand:- start:22026 stop:22664 length:639 start_codon:yes stop_codon:yes gene_type:complete